MKVTVSFDEKRVVVPCDNGEITIRELINRATIRYKKVFGFPEILSISVSSLIAEDSNGLLDLDDIVLDVCDNREHLIAVFTLDNEGSQDEDPTKFKSSLQVEKASDVKTKNDNLDVETVSKVLEVIRGVFVNIINILYLLDESY